MGELGSIFKKVKHKLTILPGNSHPRHLPQRRGNSFPYKDLYMNVPNSFDHKSPKLETIQTPINWWREKQNAVQSCNGIVFSNKKKWTTNSCYSTDEPHKRYAKLMKPDAKVDMVYDNTYVKCPRKANLETERSAVGWCGNRDWLQVSTPWLKGNLLGWQKWSKFCVIVMSTSLYIH